MLLFVCKQVINTFLYKPFPVFPLYKWLPLEASKFHTKVRCTKVCFLFILAVSTAKKELNGRANLFAKAHLTPF